MRSDDARWRVRHADGSEREYSFDDLMGAMKRGEITPSTLIREADVPDETKTRPAGEWGTFWQKFSMDESDVRRAWAILEVLYAMGEITTIRQYCADSSIPQEISSYACGMLMRPWLPRDAGRRLLMFVLTIAVIGTAATVGSFWPLVFLVIPLSFSPRAVTEILLFVSHFRRAT